MKRTCLLLYHAMLFDMKQCSQREKDAIRQIELLYAVVTKYCSVLQSLSDSCSFRSKKEEIDFWKRTRPLFFAHLFYYELLYHHELFRPSGEKALRRFLLREKSRLTRFITNNTHFYLYSKSAMSCYDNYYFTKGGQGTLDVKVKQSCLVQPFIAAGSDERMAELIALERYDCFPDGKMNTNQPTA